ncbi:MAG: hypothetical protein AVDCRST_MAG03-2716, partial [uncultured Rubrobacteraceae bacterium]
RARLPGGPLLHALDHGGPEPLRPRLRPFRVGLEPLRHGRLQGQRQRRRGGFRLVLAGRPHRGRPRRRGLPGPRRSTPGGPQPQTGPTEPAPDGCAHGPLHRHEPLGPLPTRRRI